MIYVLLVDPENGTYLAFDVNDTDRKKIGSSIEAAIGALAFGGCKIDSVHEIEWKHLA